MTMKTDHELIEHLQKTRNISKSTLATYKIYIREYSEYNNMPMVDLIKEAEAEEEQGVRWKKRKIKTDYLNSEHTYMKTMHTVPQKYVSADYSQYIDILI